jgi:hypothetical protein
MTAARAGAGTRDSFGSGGSSRPALCAGSNFDRGRGDATGLRCRFADLLVMPLPFVANRRRA